MNLKVWRATSIQMHGALFSTPVSALNNLARYALPITLEINHADRQAEVCRIAGAPSISTIRYGVFMG